MAWQQTMMRCVTARVMSECISLLFFYLWVRYSNCLFLYFIVYLVRDVLRPGVVEIIHGPRGILSVCVFGGGVDCT